MTTDTDSKAQGWPCHSSQKGLIEELLDAGITVTLTYQVEPVTDINQKLHREFERKQRL
jgi:hypothetical protein